MPTTPSVGRKEKLQEPELLFEKKTTNSDYCMSVIDFEELLAQCDASSEMSPEDRAWLDAKPIGKELL